MPARCEASRWKVRIFGVNPGDLEQRHTAEDLKQIIDRSSVGGTLDPGEAGMLGYVKNVQRQEIRQGIATVKHQNMSGSDIGDDHKEYFAGEAALKAGGANNTMSQFAAE